MWLQPHPVMAKDHPLQTTSCIFWLLTATRGRSQGGEEQGWPGKSLGGKVEVATRDVWVLLSHPMAGCHPCAGLQQPPAWCLVWESSSHCTPAEQTGSHQWHTGSLAPSCWVAGTQRENKRNTTKSNSITAQGKALLGKACSSPPPLLSPSTIAAALMQMISEQEESV